MSNKIFRKTEYNAKNKLKSGRGETLTETLVAVLISSLALTILASMINYSSKAVRSSEANMDAYYKASNQLEAGTVSSPVSGTAQFKSGGTALKLVDGDTSADFNLTYYKNSAYNGFEIYTYK